MRVESKNKKSEIVKLTLQIIGFVDSKLMDFPVSEFTIQTFTSNNLFEDIYKIINVKIHLYLSHVTGKIFGCADNFCNRKVTGHQTGFSCSAHNFFGLDIYFLIKGVRFSVWETKDL